MLEIGEGVFEVKSTAGDTHLGGDDFDQAIVDWLVASSRRIRASTCRRTRWRFSGCMEAAEKAKIELSTTRRREINLPFITADASGPKHLDTRR